MIKTKTAVVYNHVNQNEKEIVFAKITETLRNDDNETYTLSIEEWVELPYSMEVPDGNGGVILQDFIEIKTLPKRPARVMTFAESDELTNNLDQMFTITETGAKRRKKYTELGHLLINNLEQVCTSEWELV